MPPEVDPVDPVEPELPEVELLWLSSCLLFLFFELLSFFIVVEVVFPVVDDFDLLLSESIEPEFLLPDEVLLPVLPSCSL